MSKMAKKISFDIGNAAISRVARPSVFDRLVREIDAIEIPPKYIQTVLVQYHDNKVVELKGSDLSKPIPMSKEASPGNLESVFDRMKDLKVFIDIAALEADVNQQVENYLGKYC
jgi:hypothetical protein